MGRKSYKQTRGGSTLPLLCSFRFICLAIAPGPGGACLCSEQNIQSTRLRKLAFMAALPVPNTNYALLTKVLKASLLLFRFCVVSLQ